MRMPCGECGGSGLVEGLGCDDKVWSVECPWCGGSGNEPPAEKRVDTAARRRNIASPAHPSCCSPLRAERGALFPRRLA